MTAGIGDGDHPDTIAVTYARANAAAELVEDLCALIPRHEWAGLSVAMLDRDLLADDEWWNALQRRRRRTSGRPSDGPLPSYSTRVTAGHMLAVSAAALRSSARPVERLTVEPWPDGYPAARRAAFIASGGACQAEGLHHPDCPGEVTGPGSFVTHHVYPRELGKREQIPAGLVDHPANLIVVWNGHTGLGAGGCHARIHARRTAARRLGLLTNVPPLAG